MRKILCFVALFGFCSSIQASPLKINVQNDVGEKLWYAYVYVNGRAVTVTDTLGFAQVPEGKLNVGDTLSVSYVGTEPRWVVYDRALQKQEEYAFVLPEKYGVLTADEVTIKADIEKLYRKEVKQRRMYYYVSLWTADFSMKVRTPDGKGRLVDGKLKFPYMMGFQSNVPRKVITGADTTGLSYFLNSDLVYALTSIHTATYVVGRPAAGTWKPSYGYRGKKMAVEFFG